jgi:hypothetical protein
MIPESDHLPRQQARAKQRATDELLRKDFRAFLYLVWEHLGLPAPTPVQLDIAKFMQHGPRRKMVQAFRGVGKTWIYAAFVCWRFYCNPEWKIMVISGTKTTADDFSRFVKRLIHEMPLLQHLIPGDDQRNSNVFFDVGPARPSKDPSMKSVGIFGQITGSRADEILADDVESLNNSATEGAREKLSESVKEFDAVLKPNGIITYLGTPQSAMTMYAKLPERGYTIRIWPARVPEDASVYNGQLAPYIYKLIEEGQPVGSSTDAGRFTDIDLAERARSYGLAGFALQFMLNTSLNDANRFPLKLGDLVTMTLDNFIAPVQIAWAGSQEYAIEGLHICGLPGDKYYGPMFKSKEFSAYTGSVMAIDPSGRGKDETAYAVVKHLAGTLFLTTAGGLMGGYEDEALDKLVEVAKAQRVTTILVEGNFGGGMFAKLLQASLKRGEYRCQVEEVTHSKQKEQRIADTLEPVIQQHRLVVNQAIINRDYESASEASYSLFWQLARLTRERGALPHDDRLDALAMAVAYWAEQMAQDTNSAFRNHLDKLQDESLREFMRNVVGGRPEKPRWVTPRASSGAPHRPISARRR